MNRRVRSPGPPYDRGHPPSHTGSQVATVRDVLSTINESKNIMIRVGFTLMRAGDDWLGGLNYIRNLLHAIVSVQGRELNLC